MLLAFVVRGVCRCCCQAWHRARLEASNTDEATTEPPMPMLLEEGPGGDGADGGEGRCGTWACVNVLAAILFRFPPCSCLFAAAGDDGDCVQPTPTRRFQLAWARSAVLVCGRVNELVPRSSTVREKAIWAWKTRKPDGEGVLVDHVSEKQEAKTRCLKQRPA